MPIKWAMTLMNLGTAFADRLMGNREQNIESAIEAFKQALEVVLHERMHEDIAWAMNNLATLYLEREQDDRAQNLEQAKKFAANALQVRTRESMPIQWAQTTSNLGNIYRVRVRSKKNDNLKRAMECYTQSLNVFTKEAMPVEWATTTLNLAVSYHTIGRVDDAIKLYKHALHLFTLDQFPKEHLRAHQNLSTLYFSRHQWEKALGSINAAIQAGKRMLDAAYTEMGRRREVNEISSLYADSAYCCLMLGQEWRALKRMEQGKTRLLGQVLALTEVFPTRISKEIGLQLKAIHHEIQALELEMRLPMNTPARRSNRNLAELLSVERKQLEALLSSVCGDLGLPNTSLRSREMVALAPKGGALIALLTTSEGGAAFIIPHGISKLSKEHILLLPQWTTSVLRRLLGGSLKNMGWLSAYAAHRQEKTAEARERWNQTISRITVALWQHLMGPVDRRLKALGVGKGSPVILLPQGWLALLPLHAAARNAKGSLGYFMDYYQVCYAPSTFTLKISQERAQKCDSKASLLAVLDPRVNLSAGSLEQIFRDRYFDAPSSIVLIGKDADTESVSREAVGRQFIYFSCHGYYNWEDVTQSCLELGNNTKLNLSDILSKMDLRSSRLVILSACETGMTEFKVSPDEYLGLPTAFLQAGAPAVLSTLWAVDEHPTFLLIDRFLWHYRGQGKSMAASLRAAQIWLRDQNADDLILHATESYKKDLHQVSVSKFTSGLIRRLGLCGPKDRPFAHPYYWAAFTINGS